MTSIICDRKSIKLTLIKLTRNRQPIAHSNKVGRQVTTHIPGVNLEGAIACFKTKAVFSDLLDSALKQSILGLNC